MIRTPGKYRDIYERAKPYLDTRKNDVHVAVMWDFAGRLLTFYPEADPDVVLPAIILHDVGWKTIPEDQQTKAFGPKMTDADLRRVHEVEGVRIAREILTELKYDPVKREEILAIIDGHDSRDEARSLDDTLLRDADRFWRFCQTGIEINHRLLNMELGEFMPWLSQKIDGWMLTPEGRAMAHAAFDEAWAALLPDQPRVRPPLGVAL